MIEWVKKMTKERWKVHMKDLMCKRRNHKAKSSKNAKPKKSQ